MNDSSQVSTFESPLMTDAAQLLAFLEFLEAHQTTRVTLELRDAPLNP